MTDLLVPAVLALTWSLAAFAALQLASTQHRRAALLLVALVAGGVAALGWRTGDLSYAWLRSITLRTDALALGVLIPLVATASALAAARVMRTRWARIVVLPQAGFAVIIGFVALALGHAGWYWEFVAIITAGVVLLVAGATTVRDPAGSANLRVAGGFVTLFGAFLAAGGGVLLTAWNATA